MAEDENDDQEWNIRFRQDDEMDFFTELALHEAERWIQAVTRKKFNHPDDFRKSLANGVLLCELLNGLKPGTVKRINKLPGAIAGLDNINVFLDACKKTFGLNKTQLFDPGDLEDLSQRAIADESEYLLKQETDRRARNVAICIYWLGRQVEHSYKGSTLDTSAFSALVHHHGNKNIISDECFRNENWQTSQASKENFKDVNSSGSRHARDSSYDSLGSYEKESESSFDELETNANMPVRDMRRYGSQSSLGKNENTRYSLANDSAFSDGRHDSLYQSSPDLSQGSHAHTRSSSNDSMDGSYYGNNHSRQSSGSTEGYPTRLSSSGLRRQSTSTATSSADPLQFVKTKGADDLAKTATKQIEAAKETTLMRPVLRGEEGEPDWQSKLSGWKNRRKSASAAVYQRVGEVEGVFTEDEEPKTKTFSQIMAEKEKRKSLGNLRSFYPIDDDESIGSKPKVLADPLHIMKTEDEITQATEAIDHKTRIKTKKEEIAPWARDSSGEGDSQSDSEANTSHQSGDTDNVFAEQTIPKVVQEDQSWVKRRTGSLTSPTIKQTPSPVANKPLKERNFQLWETSAKESQTRTEKKRVEIPTSNNKIRNITKAFEEKESSAKAEPVISRRSDFGRKSWSFDSTDSPFRRRSSDFSDKSDKSSPKGISEKTVSPLLSPTAPKALLPKDQRTPPGSNFKFPSDYNSNKKVESSRSKYLQKMSAPPQAPFGYKAGRSHSVIELPTTYSKPSVPKVASAGSYRRLRGSSSAGSDSSEAMTPTSPSEAFHPMEAQPDLIPVSEIIESTSKDQDILKERDSSEVTVCSTCTPSVVRCASSSVSAEANSQMPSQVDISKPHVDTIGPLTDTNVISFYLTSEDESESHSEVSESVTESIEKKRDQDETSQLVSPSLSVVGKENDRNNAELKDTDVVKQEDADMASKTDIPDTLSCTDSVTARNTDDETLIVQSEVAETDAVKQDKTLALGQDLGQDLPLKERQITGIEEHIVPTSLLQTGSAPNFFVFPEPENIRVENKNPEICSVEPTDKVLKKNPEIWSVEPADRVKKKNPEICIVDPSDKVLRKNPEIWSVEPADRVQKKNSEICSIEPEGATEQISGFSLSSQGNDDEHSDAKDLEAEDSIVNGTDQSTMSGPSLISNDKEGTSETEADCNNTERPPGPLSPVSSNGEVLSPEATSASSIEVCPSSTPDLITSLPTLTPSCGSEDFPPRNHSSNEDDVFVDDDTTYNQRSVDKVAKEQEELVAKEKSIEKSIKISQAPNNSRGFGFFIVGGSEKREPITVQRVSLGSGADLCDLLAQDEILSVNNHDTTHMTLKQVQGIIDHSVKRGQIELKVKRRPDEGSFDSLDEESSGYLDRAGNNKMDTQSDSSSFSTDPLSDDTSFKASQVSSRQTGSDENEKPSLMDRLLAEKSREMNNNFDLSDYNKANNKDKPPSPVAVENLKAEVAFSSHSTPKRKLPETPPKTEVTIGVKSESPTVRRREPEPDMKAPDNMTVTVEPSTLSVQPSPVEIVEEPIVVMRRKRTPEKPREEPAKSVETPPPAPPSVEPPSLPKSSYKSTQDDSSGFGPPAALLRWQRPRAKSEYINPYPALFNEQVDKAKRLSSTLPWRPMEADSKDRKDVTKDDSVLNRATQDFESTMSVSKAPLLKSKTYHFDDVSKLQEWDEKQEEERKHDDQDERPVTPPAFEVEIRKEQHLTPQPSSKPVRKKGVPNLMDFAVTIPGQDEPPLSPQEKFERDQQRIRQQYEEEKRRAREAEKQREEQEQKVLKADSVRLLNLESQIQPDNLEDMKPVHPVQSQPPKFTSEPMTMKIPQNSQGRQLVIDPKNQEDKKESSLPQYSFHVDLKQQEDKPPLRNLNREPELSAQELLEKERERIREEEHRKFEEEKRRWKEEQDEQLRREQERLREEREEIEREKAKLEHKQEVAPRYQPISVNTYQSSRSPSGSTGSPVSHSPKSPPPALDPQHRGHSRKPDIWAPPSTLHAASKSDTGMSTKEKARLTREDLLAMNRKPTPLQSVQGRQESADREPAQVTREAPSKLELHMLNSVPKPKFRRSADWIKDEDPENSSPTTTTTTSNANTDKYADKQFVIGKRSDIIHKDYSSSQDHWLVQEAERRRLAELKDYGNRDTTDSVHTAGPAKPSASSLVNRFRGDAQPNKNRYSYPAPRDQDSYTSPSRPLSTSGSGLRQYERSASPELSSTQFSARNQSLNYANPSLSNTLPANFSFNANKPVRREPPAPAPKPQRSPTEQAEQMNTVSGKQKCSHCSEELGFGAAMVIESLGLYYHVQCFRCCVCRTPLGNGSEGADVRVRVNKLHCRNCFSNDEAGLKFSKV